MGNCSAAPSPKSEPLTSILSNPKNSTAPPASASSGQDVKLQSNNGQSLAAAPKNLEDLRQKGGGLYKNVTTFTYAELRVATKNFRPDKVIGEGGFGVVYKGSITNSNNGDDDEDVSTTVVAVKQLNPEGFQGDREWLAEVNYLGQLSHPNLVKLIGYCCEGTQRLLVYEYMACGSLEKHLFRRVCLTMPWSTRMKIALGAAKGLAFLHSAQRPIIYRDFKTSNILLDADYNAKLSDFGLAKEGPIGDQTHVSTRVVGTYGYAAPEYVMTGHLTARSDVYGFGVVLLEMLIGRKAVDSNRPSREHNLVDWARPLLVHNKKLLKIVDPRMEGQYTTKTLGTIANLTYQCLSQNPKGRPEMHQVVETIESIQNLPEIKGDLLLNNGDAAVTLFEAPRENSNTGTTMSRDVNGRRKMRPANGRSKSEPPKELQLYM